MTLSEHQCYIVRVIVHLPLSPHTLPFLCFPSTVNKDEVQAIYQLFSRLDKSHQGAVPLESLKQSPLLVLNPLAQEMLDRQVNGHDELRSSSDGANGGAAVEGDGGSHHGSRAQGGGEGGGDHGSTSTGGGNGVGEVNGYGDSDVGNGTAAGAGAADDSNGGGGGAGGAGGAGVGVDDVSSDTGNVSQTGMASRDALLRFFGVFSSSASIEAKKEGQCFNELLV